MKKNKKTRFEISRRKFFPFLSAGFLLPFFGHAKTAQKLVEEDEGYQTLLTKDGKAVRVKKNAVRGSKVVDKGLSNKSLLSWLKKSDKDIKPTIK